MYRQIEDTSAANVPVSVLELLGLPLPKEESFEMINDELECWALFLSPKKDLKWVNPKEESFEMVNDELEC